MKSINELALLMMFSYVLSSKKYSNASTKACMKQFFSKSEPHELDDCKVDEKTKEILLNNIRRRLTPQAVKCRAGQNQLIRNGTFSEELS